MVQLLIETVTEWNCGPFQSRGKQAVLSPLLTSLLRAPKQGALLSSRGA